jgi:hypothetical protein
VQRAEAGAVAASDAAVGLRAELAAAQQSAAETDAALGNEQHSARQAAAAAAEARQQLRVTSSFEEPLPCCMWRWCATHRLLQGTNGFAARPTCCRHGDLVMPQLVVGSRKEPAPSRLSVALQERQAKAGEQLRRQVAQWQREALALRGQLADLQVPTLASVSVAACGGLQLMLHASLDQLPAESRGACHAA